MKRIIFIVLFIATLAVHSSPIIVGILPFAPPFSEPAGDGNNYYGFAIDIMNSLCQRIHRECTYKAAPLNSQVALLNRGEIDLAFTPNVITSIDNGNYIYSLPYMASDGQFLALQGSSINSINDITNKKIGVLGNTLYQALLQSIDYMSDEIKPYQEFSDLISALVNQQVDVIIINSSLAHYVFNSNESTFKLVGNKIPLGEGYGILSLKKNAELIKEINSALLGMEVDGSYLAIYSKYFGSCQ